MIASWRRSLLTAATIVAAVAGAVVIDLRDAAAQRGGTGNCEGPCPRGDGGDRPPPGEITPPPNQGPDTGTPPPPPVPFQVDKPRSPPSGNVTLPPLKPLPDLPPPPPPPPPTDGGPVVTPNPPTGTPPGVTGAGLPPVERLIERPPSGTDLPPPGLPPPGGSNDIAEALPGEVLILLRPGQGDAVARAIARDYGLDLAETIPLAILGTEAYRLLVLVQRPLGPLVDLLNLDPRILLAQANYRYRTSQAAAPANGQLRQYALERLQAEQAHRIARGQGVTVAVIDTRVDPSHPALQGRVAESIDVVGGNTPDPGQHGTALAGVIAADGRLRGIAPAVRLVAIQAFSPDPQSPGSGLSSSDKIARAVDVAVDRGSKVLNLSFAGPRDPIVGRMIRRAVERGAVVVAAVGNDGLERTRYPAAFDGVIAVTATDARDRLYSQANRGSHVGLAAPGVDIVTTGPSATVQSLSGTSMAAAYVSGVAALLIERDPTLTPADVRAMLEASAVDLGAPGKDAEYGAGRIDAFRALGRGRPSSARPAASR